MTKALEALAKPKSDIKKLKELGASAKEFKNKFDELQCEELAEQIACLKAKQMAIGERTDLTSEQKDRQKQKIEEEIKPLLELTNEQKCDPSKRDATKCPDQKG